jgi:hypothetical protein
MLFHLFSQLFTNILLARNQYLLSPNPFLIISMFLALLYVLGLVTAMSIQLDSSHPSQNIIQLTCPYLTRFSEYLPTYVSLLKTVHWISKTIFWKLNKISFYVSQQQHISYLPFDTYTGIYVPCTYLMVFVPCLCTHVPSIILQIMACNTLLTRTCDRLVTLINLLIT